MSVTIQAEPTTTKCKYCGSEAISRFGCSCSRNTHDRGCGQWYYCRQILEAKSTCGAEAIYDEGHQR
jgi:hypothetical protein